MRWITGITLNNYRAFGKPESIDIPNGYHLLVYGENGSGKSSIYNGLKDFFASSFTSSLVSFKLNEFEKANNNENGKIRRRERGQVLKYHLEVTLYTASGYSNRKGLFICNYHNKAFLIFQDPMTSPKGVPKILTSGTPQQSWEIPIIIKTDLAGTLCKPATLAVHCRQSN